MKKASVNIDFEIMSKARREFVIRKAIKCGSTIVYVKDGNLIEENPGKGTSRVLKRTHAE